MHFSDVAGRKFSNCNLQRKLTNEEVMQKKWLVYSAGKIGYFAFVASCFPINAALSIDGFSNWCSASFRLAEHRKFTCHSHSSVQCFQWFESKQN